MPENNPLKRLILESFSSTTPINRKKLRKSVIKEYCKTNNINEKELKSIFKETLQELIDADKITYDLVDDTCRLTIASEISTDRKIENSSMNRKRQRSESESTLNEKKPKSDESVKVYPPRETPTGNVTILLFYAYSNPQMTRAAQDNAIAKCSEVLRKNGVTGRLRIGREGYNATLTGPHEGTRAFTSFLRTFDPSTFGETDFKYVDNQPSNQLLKDLKVWPVTEIVTYGFDPSHAPLDMRGIHLPPKEFHEALANPNSILIDVRNFNETMIGKFSPPRNPGQAHDDKVLDPMMRRSTEFPKWVEENKPKFEGKQVLMCCTAGVRCERASAYMRMQGVENVYQLEGGIHRYLDAYPEDGGFWKGKNYTFDKRFSHGAKEASVISKCIVCDEPWERYQAMKKCVNTRCAMEILVCKTCDKTKPSAELKNILCPLCKAKKSHK